MNCTLLIIGGIALVGVAYYSYQRRKSKKNLPKKELIDELVSNFDAENVIKLSLSDVVNYFKSLSLKKGKDIPFIAVASKDEVKLYLLASYNEETDEVENYKLIAPESIDDKLINVIGNEALVVLS